MGMAFMIAEKTDMASISDNARIDFIVPAELRQMVEQAAALRGQTVTEFAVATLADSAQRVIQQHQVTDLSNRDRDIFLAMLDDDNSQPSEALMASAQAYKDWVSRGKR